MSSTRIRSALFLAALCLPPAASLFLLTTPAEAKAKKVDAKKAKAAAARPKAAPSSASSVKTEAAPSVSASSESAPRAAAEVPLSATESPPAVAPVAPSPSPPVDSKPAAESAPVSAPTVDSQVPSSNPEASAEVTEMPEFGAPAKATDYVEHLGPNSYPGTMRGLYGGSLWLEPSFHGLQWPYMAKTGVGVSGSAWVDTGMETITREADNTPNTKRYLQQGRATLRVTPTFVSGRFFIQGQVEVVGNQCQTAGQICLQNGTVDTDDLWLRIGHWNVWDLKVGRFEAWELYHTGMGLDINTLERRGAQLEGTGGLRFGVPDYYGLTFMHDRPSAMGQGNVAGHWYPLSTLRFELLGTIGTDDASQNGKNILGIRPMGILDLGYLKIKGGGEYEKITMSNQEFVPVLDANGSPVFEADGVTQKQRRVDQKGKTTRKGYAVSAQFILHPRIEFGANFGRGYQTTIGNNGSPDDYGSYDVASIGGFANFRVGGPGTYLGDLLIGTGANWTTWYDSHRVVNASGEKGNTDYAAHLQGFVAVQYLIAKQLFVKMVLAYARGDLWPSEREASFSNTMLSGRVRLMYLF